MRAPVKGGAAPIDLAMAPLIKGKTEDTHEDPDVVREAFSIWCDDESHKDAYNKWSFNGPRCLVRVYKFVPKDVLNTTTHLIDVDGSSLVQKHNSRVLPFVKVLIAGSDSAYAADDVRGIDQKLAKLTLSPLWVEWRAGQKKRPIPETSLRNAPDQFIEGIYAWAEFMFIADPFDPVLTEDDRYTFLIPDVLMMAGYDYS